MSFVLQVIWRVSRWLCRDDCMTWKKKQSARNECWDSVIGDMLEILDWWYSVQSHDWLFNRTKSLWGCVNKCVNNIKRYEFKLSSFTVMNVLWWKFVWFQRTTNGSRNVRVSQLLLGVWWWHECQLQVRNYNNSNKTWMQHYHMVICYCPTKWPLIVPRKDVMSCDYNKFF